MRHILCLLVWPWSLFLGFCFAQSYKSRIYTEVEGLPSRVVLGVTQDIEGKMWFATRLGVASYDGSQWETYHMSDGLPTTAYFAIDADPDGAIWVFNRFKKTMVSRIFKGEIQNYPALPLSLEPVRHRCGSGVMRFRNTFAPVVSVKGQGIFFFDTSWRRIGRLDESGLNVNDIAAHGRDLYIAGDDGLSVWSEDRLSLDLNEIIPEDFRTIETLAVSEDDQGEVVVWIASKAGIGCIRNNQFEIYSRRNFYTDANSFHESNLVATPSDGVIISNRHEVVYIPSLNDPPEVWDSQTGLAAAGGLDMTFDYEGNLWVGGIRGVTRVSGLRFRNYQKDHGLFDNEVTSILEVGDRMLLGHNRGFTWMDGNDMQTIKIPNQDRPDLLQRVMELHQGKSGRILFALLDQGVAELMPDNSVRFMSFPQDNKDHLFLSVIEDEQGTIWACGPIGVYRSEGEGIVSYKPDYFADVGGLRRLYMDRQNRIFITGMKQGLFMKEGENWAHYTTNNPQSDNVYNVYQDSQGRHWVGALGGVYFWNDGVLRKVDEPGFELKQPAYFIVESPDGEMWFGTDSGIFRYDGAAMTHYSSAHGLVGQETNRGAGTFDKKGRLWVGADRGLSIFESRFDTPFFPPRLDLKDVQVDGISVGLKNNIILEPDQNDLSFEFEAISFADEKNIAFSYKLDGLDEMWSKPFTMGQRYKRFNNLPFGDYRFQIKAQSAHGLWSEIVASPTIRIKRPFWRTLSFILVVSLIGLMVLYSLIDYSSSKRYSQYLKSEIEARTLELSEKNTLLEEKVIQHLAAEAEVKALNEELEDRVKSRTDELQEAQKDLIENAHYAGMAEISTSILHNVGNILNSISTSGYIIQQTISASKVKSLGMAVQVLDKEKKELFDIKSQKGDQLLQFFQSVSGVLDKENDKLSLHITSLLEKIDTIKDVVSQQHNYASGTDVYQLEDKYPKDLIETSLIIIGDLEEKGLTVEVSVETTDLVRVQKTKMIHTLVNILKNAKESILTSGSVLKEIRIRAWRDEDEVLISIEDTGGGIAPENLRHIFSHGFTTKKQGNGFGLHSCANAMSEMGGSVHVDSKGVGYGACFTMTLPIPKLTNNDRQSESVS